MNGSWGKKEDEFRKNYDFVNINNLAHHQGHIDIIKVPWPRSKMNANDFPELQEAQQNIKKWRQRRIRLKDSKPVGGEVKT